MRGVASKCVSSRCVASKCVGKTSGWRKFAMMVSVLTACAASGETANGACADMWVTKFTGAKPTRCPPNVSSCTDGSDTRPAVFHAGDQFALCVKLPYAAYITLWDATPNGGDVHRIYPNFLTHKNNATVLGERITGQTEHCFGYQDFPLYFPRSQGLGQGKLTVFATPALDDQPTPADMRLAGQTMARPRHEMIAATLSAAVDCHTPYSQQISYNVIE
jgi:hypothetical protein